MTVLVEDVISTPFAPDGATTTFPFEFQIGAEDEVEVVIDGVTVDPALYSVTLNDDGTGSVVFFTAPTGTELYLLAAPTFGQPTTLQNQGPFYQRTIETALDRLARGNLWLKARLARIVPTLLLTTALTGKYLTWDADGNPVFSSGTGADAGLREDLGAADGIGLVGGLQGIIGRTAESFGATGDGIANDLTALRLGMIALKNGDIQQLHLRAGAEYYIGSFTGAVQLTAFGSAYLAGATGKIIGNGATITFNSDGVTSHDIFLFSLNTDIEIEGLNFRDLDGTTTADVSPQGVRCVSIMGGTAADARGYTFRNMTFTDCFGCIMVQTSNYAAAGRIANIHLDNVVAQSCYYGLSCANDGDWVTGTLACYDVKRPYFVYGVRGHDLNVSISNLGTAGFGSDGAIKIGRYERNTHDVHVRTRFSGTVVPYVPVNIFHLNGLAAGTNTDQSLIENVHVEVDFPDNVNAGDATPGVKLTASAADGTAMTSVLAAYTNVGVTTLHKTHNLKIRIGATDWGTEPFIQSTFVPFDPGVVDLEVPQNVNRRDVRLQGFLVNGWFTVEKTGASLNGALFPVPLYHVRNSRFMVEMELMAVEAVDSAGITYFKRLFAHSYSNAGGATTQLAAPAVIEDMSTGTPDMTVSESTGYQDFLLFATSTAASFTGANSFARMRARVVAVKA